MKCQLQIFTLFIYCVLLSSVDCLPYKARNILNSLKGDERADGQPTHLIPPVISELGEIGLFVLDIIWHHDIVQHIEQVGEQVQSVDDKLDQVLSILEQQRQTQQRPFARQSDVNIKELPAASDESKGTKIASLLTWALGSSVFAFTQWLTLGR